MKSSIQAIVILLLYSVLSIGYGVYIDFAVNEYENFDDTNGDIKNKDSHIENACEKRPYFKDKMEEINQFNNVKIKTEEKPKEKIGLLKDAIEESKRINFVLLGIEEDPRADSMIFVSFDPETKEAHMISIPRDTYYHEEGYDNGDQRKLNAAYGRGREKETIKAIEEILCGVPIHHYVTLRYDGVQKIVDSLGGVEVEIPKKIGNVSPGKYNLDGQQAIKFLRYRYCYPDGDIGRVKAQQDFIKSITKKLLITGIIKSAETIFDVIETDISKVEIVSYAMKALGISVEDISMDILPGKAKYEEVGKKKWSYYFYDQEKTKILINQIYNVREPIDD